MENNHMTDSIDLPRDRSRPELRRITALDDLVRDHFLSTLLEPTSTHSKHYHYEVSAPQGTFFEDHTGCVYEMHRGRLVQVTRDEVRSALAPVDLWGHLRAILQNESGEDEELVLKKAFVASTWARSTNEEMELRQFVQVQERSLTQMRTGLHLPNLEGSVKQVAWAESLRRKGLESVLLFKEELCAESQDEAELHLIEQVFEEWLEHLQTMTDATDFIDYADQFHIHDIEHAFPPALMPPLWRSSCRTLLNRMAQLFEQEEGERGHDVADLDSAQNVAVNLNGKM